MPRYSGWSFEMTSACRQEAMTGTWSSSANLTSSVEVRARRTPAPARMTGRSAPASRLRTLPDLGLRDARAAPARGCRRPVHVRGDLVEQVLGQGQQDRSGPATKGLAHGLRHHARDLVRRSWAAPPIWPADQAWRPGRSPGRPPDRGTRAGPARRGRTSASSPGGPCGCRWPGSPAPTARVPRQTAGRPVSWPYASAMNAAPPSWRVAMTRMPAPSRASRTPRNDSPGTVNAIADPGGAQGIGDRTGRPCEARSRRSAISSGASTSASWDAASIATVLGDSDDGSGSGVGEAPMRARQPRSRELGLRGR